MTTDEDLTNASRIGGIVAAVALVALLVTGAIGPAVAQSDVTRSAVVFDMHEDGTTEVTVVLTFDLTTETERQAFKSIQENSSTKEDIRTRFESRMEQVATGTSDRLDRDVSVTDTSIDVETADDGQTGVVRLTATMTNLAAVDGDQLTLTEPLTSGFYMEREVVVQVPDGYEVATVTPDPTATNNGAVTWDSGTEFDGFELVAQSTDEATDANGSGSDDTTATQSPGFGLAIGVLAVISGSLLAFKRHKS